jgi:hypothetical protein
VPRNVFCRLRTALLAATLDAATVTAAAVGPLPDQPMMHLDAGYDYQPCRQVVAARAMAAQIATAGCRLLGGGAPSGGQAQLLDQAVLPPTGPKAWLACGRRSRPWIH